MEEKELIALVNKDLQVALPESLSREGLQEKLAAFINELALHHFEQLISLLYRIDISEAKIKALLKNNTERNAGDIIAALIIERQSEKIRSRKIYSQKNNDPANDNEKW